VPVSNVNAGVNPFSRVAVANTAVKLLTELGIATEMTGQRKNRSLDHPRYIELLATD
jgi:hypothetical protein